MTQQVVSLMDVLAPPGNHWLMELSHRKTGLPTGVHIVRFNDGYDDLAEEDGDTGMQTKHQNKFSGR
jgi:hypothetical protein